MLKEKAIFHGQGRQKPCLVRASGGGWRGEGAAFPQLTTKADLQDPFNWISLKTRLISA